MTSRDMSMDDFVREVRRRCGAALDAGAMGRFLAACRIAPAAQQSTRISTSASL